MLIFDLDFVYSVRWGLIVFIYLFIYLYVDTYFSQYHI
jgi:hypothetical protein